MAVEKSYTELAFEESCESILLRGGYVKGYPATLDRALAIDTGALMGFVKATQPEAWQKLSVAYGLVAEKKLISRLCDELNKRGTLDVLRRGIDDYNLGGQRLHLCYFKPASSLNPMAAELYEKNIVTCTRQVKYSLKNENSLDMVLALNGLPLVTIELKNPMTGQSYVDAMNQYKHDRDPRELLFQFKKRALVHFAVDPDWVYMTTHLRGPATYFLPFNRGSEEGGAGNPHVLGKNRTDYLWEEVLSRDSLMDIVEKFLHLQVDEDPKTGQKKETLIFPRYHQLDVVRKLERDVKEKGAGEHYLIQHSAGSGKSNSIAWLAHRLSGLHDGNNKAVFSSTIVVTDRKVLDKQLQDTIFQFEHKLGVVAKIDQDSNQLADALLSGTRIIITTLQKFPFILHKVGDLTGRSFAVIVDEAHSSQTGEASKKLKAALADVSLEQAVQRQQEEEAKEEDYEDVINRELSKQGRHSNLSFFGFTATPKNKTLEVFGHIDAKGKPRPFHLYSMRQAIEENFIIDVLKNYMTYATYFKLAKAIEDDPKYDKKKANRAIGKYLSLHPHNLAQKTEVIIEHFRDITRHKIGNRAKAMVVTGSRLHAVRYYQEFRRYIKEKGYTDLEVLVAFSGTVLDDGDSYTEEGLNRFGEKELPAKFDTDEYQVLIVAEKYQTGFDQPLLHTMFVDKKLSGVKAVQTLSRLNRIHPGKDDTFILDFVNDIETIRQSFQPYYEQTVLEDVTDPNLVYDLKNKLADSQVFTQSEVELFAKVFFKPGVSQTGKDHPQLNSALNPGVDRYKAKPEVEQDDFKSTLISFDRMYSFLTQIVRFQDPELHKVAAFAKLLLRKLPRDHKDPLLALDDDVALEYYRLQETSNASIYLKPGEVGVLTPVESAGTARKADEQLELLSRILSNINEKLGTEFTEMDKVLAQMAADFANDSDLTKKAQANAIENFKFPFEAAFDVVVVQRMMQNDEFFRTLLSNAELSKMLKDQMLPIVYERLRASAS